MFIQVKMTKLADAHAASWRPKLFLRRWTSLFLCLAVIVSSFAHVDGSHALEHDAVVLVTATSAEGLDAAETVDHGCDDGAQHGADETCSINVACSFALPLAAADALDLTSTSNPNPSSIEDYSGRQIRLIAPPPKLTIQI
jgi:hypothetical protein